MARGMHKPEKLKRRQAAWDAHGKAPGNNPGKAAMDMHKPGSLK